MDKTSPQATEASARADVRRAAVEGCDSAALDRIGARVAARRDDIDGRLLIVRVVADADAGAYEWILERNTPIAGATVIRFDPQGGTISATDFVPSS